jgi:hypothetical protein
VNVTQSTHRIGGRLLDAPEVPDGFEAVVRIFGDPRPLLSADGALLGANRARWEQDTLARGTLPFPIPLDADQPAAGVKLGASQAGGHVRGRFRRNRPARAARRDSVVGRIV